MQSEVENGTLIRALEDWCAPFPGITFTTQTGDRPHRRSHCLWKPCDILGPCQRPIARGLHELRQESQEEKGCLPARGAVVHAIGNKTSNPASLK